MIKSLLINLGMLSMTMGMVFWIRWSPQPPIPDFPSVSEKQVIASQATGLDDRPSRAAGSAYRNGPEPNIASVVPTEPSNTAIRLRVDLNRASAGELELLPGIGAVLARRVIAFRESVGRFQKIEDLRGVKGIGAKKFERLKSFVLVSAANS